MAPIESKVSPVGQEEESNERYFNLLFFKTDFAAQDNLAQIQYRYI